MDPTAPLHFEDDYVGVCCLSLRVDITDYLSFRLPTQLGFRSCM